MGHPPSANTTVADLFRSAQQRAGVLVNKDFAARIGLCENHYNAVLRGKRIPKPATLKEIGRKAGINVRTLIVVAALERAKLDRFGIVIDTVEQAQDVIARLNLGDHAQEDGIACGGNHGARGEFSPQGAA